MDILKHCIAPETKISDAMHQMTDYNIDLLIVCEGGTKVLGIVTDGDLRRGLTKGLELDGQVQDLMSKDFLSLDESVTDRAYILDMMMARRIRHIPVIGQDKTLKGIHFMQHIIGGKARPNVAVIMAGGRGTRLGVITENCPKPMLKVAGRPILERIVLHLVSNGIRKIYLAVNYMGEVIEDFFCDGSKYGCTIEYLRETKALGTGGALKLLPTLPEHPIFVMNGDLVTSIAIDSMFAFHDQHKAAATIATKRHQTKIPFGVIERSEDQNILQRIVEKPVIEHEVNAGAYILNPECIKFIPDDVEFPITDLFPLLHESGHQSALFETEEEWIDVGRPDDLKKASGY